jgi:type IV secretory pathway VirB10-like protein
MIAQLEAINRRGARARLALGAVICSAALAAAACSDVQAVPPPATPTTATTVATSTPTASPTATEAPAPAQAPAVVQAPVAAQPPPPPANPYAAATAAGASAVCADRTWSYSKNRSGTCSSHGGVHWWTGNLGPAGPGAH